MSESYRLYGKHVSEQEFTEEVLRVLRILSKKEPGKYFPISDIQNGMCYYKRRDGKMEDWFAPSDTADPQQIKEVLDKEIEREGEKRVKFVPIVQAYSLENYLGKEEVSVLRRYRSVIDE